VTVRLPQAIRLGGHLAVGVQRVTTDAVAGSVRALPRTPDKLDTATLTRLLGTPVQTVTVLSGDAGTSSRARLRITGESVPDTVFVKLPAQAASTRLMGELGRLGETEVRFYSGLSGRLSGVPRCHGAEFSRVTGRYVLVLEDLPAAECEFLDTLHPLPPDRASLLVELLARVHGAFWNRVPDWVYSASGDDTSLLTGSLLKVSARRIAERTDIGVGVGRFIDENYRAIAEVTDSGEHTVMHGDAHPGNVYFRNGAAGLLDWQAVRRGHPSRELAYTLVTAMATEDRRTHQRDLLDTYRAVLRAAGGPDLDRDELWLRYRQAAQYAYAAPLITAGMGGMQDETIALEGVRRGVAAIEDLDTVDALRRAI
jgi:hypothetical protein